jgi:hypothetical protein
VPALSQPQPPSRWQLIRDLLAFQFKLALDGLRDVLLSPISIGAAIIGLLTSREDPGKHFYRLLKLGHESDRWINLFNTHEEVDGPSSDTLVRQAESLVKTEVEKGGVVSGLKNHTDNVLDRIQKRHSSKPDATEE